MKNLSKKSILQKTIIAILIALLLSNFIAPTYSQATGSEFGGVLISPIVDLFCSVGDAVINLLQVCMTGNFASSEAMNWSLSAFLMESGEYYNKYGTSANSLGDTVTITVNPENEFDKGWLGKKDEYYIPVATYSPEQIFANNVSGLDINFINPNEYDGQNQSSASKLQPTIATWYVALRNLTIVGLLSVLVYVGIRIIISSTASDKAKYKQMLMDWLIALCLVFFLHYIMSFTLTLTQSITQAIAGNGESTVIVKDLSGNGGSGATFGTNLLGLARFKTQYLEFGSKIAYLIMYLALVIYTLIFTWFYLKRLLMMAFLTLIAPVVALTYPIDKISDGKAQAFDYWLKEYIFNALIQPFHLIIYTVFVGSAMDLASTNIIYMIAALAFILPAEKILRKFFGFEKAGATLGDLAGAAALGTMAKKMIGGGKGKAKASGGDKSPDGEKPLRFENKHDINDIEDANQSNAQPSGGASSPDDNEANDSENPVERMRREALEEQIADGTLSEDELTEEQKRILGRNSNNNNNQNAEDNEENKDNEESKNNQFTNWRRAHNITLGSAAGLAWRGVKGGIKGAARFGTRTAFKAGAGTLAGAVALASGSGLAGASAAFMAGSSLGGKVGNAAVNAGGFVASGVSRVGKGIAADWKAKDGEHGTAFANAILGGTRLGREIDLAKGNTRYQDSATAKEIKEDKNNIQYVREYIAAQNGGIMPSAKEVRDKMDSFDPYIAEGLTDIKDMLKAQKAEGYVSSQKQAAIIAAIGKERGITADILNDDKRAKAQEANLRQDFMNKGYSQAAATKQANYTMNVLKVQNGVAHNLQKIDKSQPVKPPKTKK